MSQPLPETTRRGFFCLAPRPVRLLSSGGRAGRASLESDRGFSGPVRRVVWRRVSNPFTNDCSCFTDKGSAAFSTAHFAHNAILSLQVVWNVISNFTNSDGRSSGRNDKDEEW